MWVLDFREDVESDFSVLHRVDDLDAMPAGRFFALVGKLGAYQGAVAALAASAPPAAPRTEYAAEPYAEHAPAIDDDADTPPEVVARMRAALISDYHGGEPIKWVDHDTIVAESRT